MGLWCWVSLGPTRQAAYTARRFADSPRSIHFPRRFPRDSPLDSSHDRRRFRRTSANCRLTYRCIEDSQVQSGHCDNVSSNGIAFHGLYAVTVGQALEIALLSEQASMPPLNAYVEVVRCEKHGGDYLIAALIQAIKGL